MLKDLPAGQRRAIAIGLWIVLGGVMVKLLLDLQPMPASKDLREVSGVVAALDEQSQRGRSGASYQLYIQLHDHGAPYRLDDSRAGNWDRYARIRNSLRRGDRLTLLVEDHRAHGQRIWEIRRGRERLLDYLTVFDADWEGRLMLYGLTGLYLALTVAGVIYLRRRPLAEAGG